MSRSRGRRTALAVLVTCCVLGGATLLVGGAASGADRVETIRPAAAVSRVDIDLDAGPVTIVAGDDLAIAVARRSDRFGRTPRITTTDHDRLLRVRGTCRAWSVGRCEAALTVTLPPDTAVTVTTRAGAIDVHDVGGDLRLRTGAGSVTGTVTYGAIEATTEAGNVALTVTEDVGDLVATTGAGSVTLGVPDARYRVDADTALGRTRIEVPTAPDARRSIQARSAVGDVTVTTTDRTAP